MQITLRAGGVVTIAFDRRSAMKWIDEQCVQGEEVSFEVEAEDPLLKKKVEEELASVLAKWKV